MLNIEQEKNKITLNFNRRNFYNFNKTYSIQVALRFLGICVVKRNSRPKKLKNQLNTTVKHKMEILSETVSGSIAKALHNKFDGNAQK